MELKGEITNEQKKEAKEAKYSNQYYKYNYSIRYNFIRKQF